MASVDPLEAYERRFRRAGLPLLIEDFSAGEDVFNRALPFFALVFAGEVVLAAEPDWAWYANAAAVAGALAVLIAAFAVNNAVRGRALLRLPDDIGAPELATFALVPALLRLAFGDPLAGALATAASNVALIGVTYLVVAYGLFPIVRWASERLLGQLQRSLVLLTRAVPLLLVFTLVLFVNTEMWQVAAFVPRAFLAPLGLLFAGLGVAFLVARLPREVRELEDELGGAAPPLSARQRANVALVMLVSQLLQVLTVTLAIGGFFVAFGLLTIGPEVRDAWIGGDGNVIASFSVFGERVELTEELLRVSGAIASFSALYYAIAILTDAAYREEFLDELTDELRSTFRERAEYLALRAGGRA